MPSRLKPQTRHRAREHARERRLAHRERLAPQVITVELDQVECVQEHVLVMAPIADAIEARDPVVTASHRLAVDDAGARAQSGEGLDDERETLGEVVARPAVEAHAVAALPRDGYRTTVDGG